MKVLHNIKNSRLIFRWLSFFPETTKTKTEKSFSYRLKPVPRKYSKSGFNQKEQKNVINPTTLIDTGLLIQVFHHTAFPPLSGNLWTMSLFWIFHLQSSAAVALFWRKAYLVPSNLIADYIKQVSHGHCHHGLFSSFFPSAVTQSACPVMFRDAGYINLFQKMTNPLLAGVMKHLRIKHSSCKGFSVHNRSMVAHLKLMSHLQI